MQFSWAPLSLFFGGRKHNYFSWMTLWDRSETGRWVFLVESRLINGMNHGVRVSCHITRSLEHESGKCMAIIKSKAWKDVWIFRPRRCVVFIMWVTAPNPCYLNHDAHYELMSTCVWCPLLFLNKPLCSRAEWCIFTFSRIAREVGLKSLSKIGKCDIMNPNGKD